MNTNNSTDTRKYFDFLSLPIRIKTLILSILGSAFFGGISIFIYIVNMEFEGLTMTQKSLDLLLLLPWTISAFIVCTLSFYIIYCNRTKEEKDKSAKTIRRLNNKR